MKTKRLLNKQNFTCQNLIYVKLLRDMCLYTVELTYKKLSSLLFF